MAFSAIRHRAVRVEHDRVAWVDLCPADLNRLIYPADRLFRGAAHPDPSRPDRQTEAAQFVNVAHGSVHQQRDDAARQRLGGQQVADQRDRSGRGMVTNTSPG